ncbi:MAG TPA: hypothetical protein VFM29_03490 [Vicinamibacteria bacterium]|nr:hypothetical protein [Vicinamibacteria bacterium]
MVQFNFSERTIKAKVVYYGPAQSGKTTNLEQIHRITDPASQNRLISLNTAQDRTLFFDLLPFSLGAVSGYDFKVQVYTVPGQVQYNATRRVVLAGADAVVFVADARRAQVKENQAAFENMKVNLLANRLVPEKVPLVLQYNKQDLPDLLPPPELDKVLNPWGRRVFPAVAARGDGVIETFAAVVEEMLGAIAVKYNLKEKGLDPEGVPEVVAEAFRSVLKEAASAAPPPGTSGPPAGAGSGRVILSQHTDSLHAAPPPASQDMGLVSEELLHRAIRSNVELAEALAGLVHEMNVGLGAILSHAELLGVYREDAREKRQAAVGVIQGEAQRLRKLVAQLGRTGEAVSSAGTPLVSRPTPAPAAGGPAATAPAPAPAPSRPAAPAAPDGSFETFVRDVLASARPALDAQAIQVDLKIPPGTARPSCPPLALHQALAGALQGLAASSAPGSTMAVRAEKKPVLLKSREGEVKRDYLMVGLAHAAALTADDQQRIVQGADPGPLGQASRLVRELGGFLRFAPLPGGAIETRVFLPLA